MLKLIRKLLYPDINRSDFLFIMKSALIGLFIAGFYGILHDQVTFTISPEYFTKVKFKQFDYVNFGFGNRVLVSIIGFLATGVAGFFIGWFLGRKYIPYQEKSIARKNINNGFILVFLSSILCSNGAFIFGYLANPGPHLKFWQNTFEFYDISEGWSFVRVAYIHYGSYAGGLIGLLYTFIFIKRQK